MAGFDKLKNIYFVYVIMVKLLSGDILFLLNDL